MSINYWVISPNVHNDASVQRWKDIIIERQNAYIGFGPDDSTGSTFFNQVKEGDIILVAQGANRNKHCYLCGIVNSSAISGEEEGTPGYAQRRELVYTLSESEISSLKLNFNGCAYGEADRIPALYKLKPWENTNDLRITTALLDAITKKRVELLMKNIKLNTERQDQIKFLWNKFKSKIKEEDKNLKAKEIDSLTEQWNLYREKLINDTFILDDYTNTLSNISRSNSMPGGYLCNFLERTTRTVLGSSKPGNAENFEVKLNNDNSTYYIKSEKKEKANKQDAENHFNNNIRELLRSIISEKDPLKKVNMVEASSYSAKQILMKLAVLDNLNDFLYIYSETILNNLYEEFIDGEESSIFSKNHQVCTVLKNLLNIDKNDKSELILLSSFLWQYSTAQAIADENNPNVIMYGSPGTGKTYAVVNNLDFVCQGDSSRYEILQFHPSFTYEDFIEGIKPKGVSKDGNIRFELVNGIFKNFCIRAKNNPRKTYYFVVDEINRANLSAVFGETLSLLEKDYRHDVSIENNSKNLIKTQYSALISELIKEDSKYKDLAYYLENGEAKFGVPNNIFFIGMMNDVDKSIDAFDLALRRRFKWIRKDCDYDVIEEETKFKNSEEFKNINNYRMACERMNNYISTDLGLGKSYEFGHSFFMKMKNIAKRKEITPNNMEVLFNLHLRPTLKEYLRSVFAESELDNKLIDSLSIFKNSIK
ncbi:MAG: AAA family ATPase [Candidatus Thiothrix sulfatifontis]|nr:MAG: AAA family ATPase [Candidatus Thiothrix sulfatifontis]